jgi:hypothetical protein
MALNTQFDTSISLDTMTCTFGALVLDLNYPKAHYPPSTATARISSSTTIHNMMLP